MTEKGRVATFDDKYNKIVEEMNLYLASHGLDMISWTYANGNTFKIRLSKKFFKENFRSKTLVTEGSS